MIANKRMSLVAALFFSVVLARAQDDQPEPQSKELSGGNAEELKEQATQTPRPCKIAEVVQQAAQGATDEVSVNDLWSQKYVLAVYDAANKPSCAVLEKFAKNANYQGKVAFAEIHIDQFKALGIAKRLGVTGVVPTLAHYYMLDGSPAKHDFDSASFGPGGTSFAGRDYRAEEYFGTALWRCLNVPPTDPPPNPVPDRVQCFPECPSRENGWVCHPQ